MEIRYAKLVGGATSGSALTVGTAWDFIYAACSVGSAARVGAGIELRVCDTSQYTMTFANRFRLRCGSGTPSNKVRIVGADSNGVPWRGRGKPISILAGDDRATWGTNAAVSPAMLTVDSVDGQGAGFPIQHLEIEDLVFDGVDGRPYTGFANMGATNNVFNNSPITLRDVSFLNIHHNVFSPCSCSDQAGLIAAAGRIIAEGCTFTQSATASSTGVCVSRAGSTGRGGYILRNCVLDGNGQAATGVNMGPMTTKMEISGCLIEDTSTGVNFPTARNTGSSVRGTIFRNASAGIGLIGREDIIDDCFITDCASAFSNANNVLPSAAQVRNITMTNCSAHFADDIGDPVFLASTYKSLGGDPVLAPRNRNV